jgi:hypothetical protein
MKKSQLRQLIREEIKKALVHRSTLEKDLVKGMHLAIKNGDEFEIQGYKEFRKELQTFPEKVSVSVAMDFIEKQIIELEQDIDALEAFGLMVDYDPVLMKLAKSHYFEEDEDEDMN